MAGHSDETSRRRSVLLSELTGTGEGAQPLPVRRAVNADPRDMDDGVKPYPESVQGESTDQKSAGKGKKTSKERIRMSAYERAMSILACGDNSQRQIREKLEKRGYEQDEIADALAMLKKKRYLRDDELMERYAAALSNKRMYGPCRIKMEMLRRFDREVVENYFEDAIGEIDFDAVALKVLEKSEDRDREHRVRRLRYLGFTTEQIRKAMKTRQG